MDSWEAVINAFFSEGEPRRVFDWDRAAELIRDRKPDYVEAGLAGDWEYTGGCIYSDGKADTTSDCYLASTWAIPMIDLDGNRQDCFVMEDEAHQRWADECIDENGDVRLSQIRWPQSALKILQGEK